MAFLLDTHAFIWWLIDPDKLSPKAFQVILDPNNAIFVSSVSAMEISTKHNKGRLQQLDHLIEHLDEQISAMQFSFLDLNFKDALLAGSLDFDHRDPFDRMLIAQAINQNLTLVSNEQIFDQTSVTRLW